MRWAARRLGLPGDLVAGVYLLLMGTALLVSPGNLAPTISDTVAILPALSALRDTGRSQPKAIDYGMLLGTAFTVESIIGRPLLTRSIPAWWLLKCLGAILAMMTLSVARDPPKLDLVCSLSWDTADSSGAIPSAPCPTANHLLRLCRQ